MATLEESQARMQAAADLAADEEFSRSVVMTAMGSRHDEAVMLVQAYLARRGLDEYDCAAMACAYLGGIKHGTAMSSDLVKRRAK